MTAIADRRGRRWSDSTGGAAASAGRGAASRTERRPGRARCGTSSGPAPAAYYVIAVVVSLFVLLGLVMVLSASAADRGGKAAARTTSSTAR